MAFDSAKNRSNVAARTAAASGEPTSAGAEETAESNAAYAGRAGAGTATEVGPGVGDMLRSRTHRFRQVTGRHDL